MNNNHRIVTVFLCYSINPFIRKIAITHLNDYTGYALVQLTTTVGNLFYLTQNYHLLRLDPIREYHLRYSICSSALTVLSSYQMTKLLKNNSTSQITTQIQILTIITSFLVDYLFNKQVLNNKQILGIFFMVSGIALTSKTSTD
tara:strand:- start:161 stop:592 length:432 start_codon:yes stop_codon:yes gene_type:complete